VGFDRKRLVRTGPTLPAFNYLAPADGSNESLADLSWSDSNHILQWLRQIERLQALEKPA